MPHRWHRIGDCTEERDVQIEDARVEEKIAMFAAAFLRKRRCELGGVGNTHRARFPTLDALLSARARAEVRLNAMRYWSCTNLLETGHSRSRGEVVSQADRGVAPGFDRVHARMLVRDAVTKSADLLSRSGGRAPPKTSDDLPSGAIVAVDEAGGVGARKKRPKGSWPFRAWQSRWSQGRMDGTWSDFKRKVVRGNTRGLPLILEIA